MEDSRDEAILAELLREWYARGDSGETVDPSELCRDHPHLASRLDRLIQRESRVRRFLADLGTTADSPPMPPVERLGDYALIDLLGQGGMSSVYRAEQKSLGRRVAVKVLHPALSADPVIAARFRREAEITAALDHPHIAPIFTVGEQDGLSYIAMKLMSGPSLDRLEAPLVPRRAAEVGVAIASALEEAHRAGVIHRDVKPGNIIFDGDVPYLLDFGLARSVDDLTMTRTGAVPGTLPYMSPEQLSRGEAPLDARTDVYSLGASLYETVVDRPPFADRDASALIRSILTRDAPSLDLRGGERDFETIVLRALDKERSRRFPSARAMATDLRRYLDGAPIGSRRAGFVTRTVRLAKRHRRTSFATLLGTLTMLALGGYLLWDDHRQAEVFGAQARIAEDAVLELRLDRGDALIGQLAARDSDHPRLAAIRTIRVSAAALVDLLDQLQGRAFALRSKRVRDALDRARRRRAETVDRRLANLGYAAAFLYLDDVDSARDSLAIAEREFPGDRAVIALRALADGSDVVGVLSNHPSAPADGNSHAFAALALRLSNRPPDEIEHELTLALGDLENARALFGMGVVLEETGKPLAALLAFRNLVGQGRRRPSVLLSLAFAEIGIGRFADAERHIELASRSASGLAPELVAAARVKLFQRQGRREDELRLVEESLARWPDDSSLLLLAGESRAADGRYREAAELLGRARDEARTEQLRLALDRTLAEVKYTSQLPFRSDVWPTPLSSEQRMIAEEVIELSATVANRTWDEEERARALLLRSRALRLCGRRAESWAHLESARASCPGLKSVELRYALIVTSRVLVERAGETDHLDDVSATGPVRGLIATALEAADRVIDPIRVPRRPASPIELELALQAKTVLSEAAGDDQAALSAVDQALASMVSRGATENADYEQLVALRDQIATRAGRGQVLDDDEQRDR